MDTRVASLGESPSSRITRSTFSTTTMASSTSRPIASTRPKSVSVLMEYPAADITPNVPSSTTGTAMDGMSVARQFWRKRYITRKTSTIASISVFTTSFTEMRTNGVVSYGKMALTPGGKNVDSSATFFFTASTVLSAFAPEAGSSAMPVAGWPLKRAYVV